MLEAMRRNSRNAIIYVLFGIIIAVFIINFGPGSRGGCAPSSPNAHLAAKVGGTSVSEQDFRFAYLQCANDQACMYQALITKRGGMSGKERQIKEFVMDGLIERELLATEAERLGFAVSEKEVEDMIAQGQFMFLGVRRIESYVLKDGKFDYERFKKVAENQLGLKVNRFIEVERRELLADKAREVMKIGSKVSPEEVKADYELRGLQVNLEYAKFASRKYEDESEPSAAEIDAYVKAHPAELKKTYEERAYLYKKQDRQARLRHVVIELEKDAPADKVEKAKKQIDAAAAKVKAGAAFAGVAGEMTTEARSKHRGGLIGWRKKGFTGLSDAVDAKVFAAKKGEVVGPERTDRGFELVLVEDFREGDLPLESAEREIAETEVQRERAKVKAKDDAQAILDRVKKGEKLEDLIPKEKPDNDKAEAQAHSFKANDAPRLQETSLFSRRGEIVENIGVSKELSKRAFELKVGEVAGPFDVSGSWVIVRAKEHRDPDMKDFDKRKAELERESARQKWVSVVDSWSKQRCTEVKSAGGIWINDEVIGAGGEGPVGVQIKGLKYEACSASRMF
jgi:peptidyl-prolyl cis-trans isomerase D